MKKARAKKAASPPEVVNEIRRIQLPQGGELEVELTPLGVQMMKQHFGLLPEQALDDDHIRMYVFGAMNTAVTKVEQQLAETADAPKPTARTRAPRVRRTTGSRSKSKKSQGS